MGEHSHAQVEAARGARRTVGAALAITLVMGIAEVVGGILSNSLALLGDAIHMFTDTLALGLAYAGAWALSRPPTRHATFGFHRVEVLGALLNGLLLVGVGVVVVYRAVNRFLAPEPVDGPLMLGVALLGLVLNAVALKLVHGHHHTGVGARGAYLHILSDLLTSVAALVGGVLVWVFGWVLADPVLALVIMGFVFRAAYGLLRDTGRILLEAAPRDRLPQTVRRLLLDHVGVSGVHDVHVWSLTSGVTAVTAHVDVAPMRLEAAVALKDRLKIILNEAGFHHAVLEVDLAPAGATEAAPVAASADHERTAPTVEHPHGLEDPGA